MNQPRAPGGFLIEIAVDSTADAIAAARHGADRIELCSRLDLDGLSPTPADVREVKARTALPVVAMLRLRAGPFTCERDELSRVLELVDAFRDAGADGVVFGFLTRAGGIDETACAEVSRRAAGMQRVFHRGFDRLIGPGDQASAMAALDSMIRLGCTRVLTAGGHPETPGASAGAASAGARRTLAGLIAHARGRIEILPGGGVRAANLAEIARTTRCVQAHSSGRVDGAFDAGEVARMRAAADQVFRVG
ncbi:MAG: copper homeostasis protein CutC [Phycisphaerales bacterium]